MKTMGMLLMVLACLGLAVVGCRDRRGDMTDSGRTIRIVSLAPNLTEIVCAVGAGSCLVGRTSACDYPSDVLASVPIIGDFGVPSMELIAAARPTLVLDMALADESVAQRMQDLGIVRRRIQCERLADIPAAIREIGRICEREERAAELANRIESTVQELQRAAAQQSSWPRVYAEIWHDPTTTVGRDAFLSELIHLAGGRNIGDSVAAGYFQIGHETVLAANPDVVLCLYMSRDSRVAAAVGDRPGWADLTAVKNGAVYGELDNDVILRPGPRVLEGIAALRRCIEGGPGAK